MEFTARSHLGRKYTRLEDVYVLPVSNAKYNVLRPDVRRKGYLFVLADGVGGARAGEVAAELASNWLFQEYYNKESGSIPVDQFLADIIQSVNYRIVNLADQHLEYKGMCTTLVAALFLNGNVHLQSVGDSRIYHFNGGRLEQINEDQSEVWELFRAGAITKDEIRHHPRRNIVTQVVGVPEKIDINQYIKPVDPEGLYLMCSDGLTDMVPEPEIAALLSEDGPLDGLADQLVARANAYGGKDNITLILIRPGSMRAPSRMVSRLVHRIRSLIWYRTQDHVKYD